MIFYETLLAGAYSIKIELREDSRGFFARSFCHQEFAYHGINFDVAQANIGYSKSKGTLRGLHYQLPPYSEAKLIRCVRGAIYDVILDLRPESVTFRQWQGINLKAGEHRMVYVPEGFSHGYLTLSEDTEILYLASQAYNAAAERGIRWDDPAFDIQWPETEKLTISGKDQAWPDWSG